MPTSPLDTFTLRRFDADADAGILDDITALLHRAYAPLAAEGMK